MSAIDREALPHLMYPAGPECPCPGSGSVYHKWFNKGREVGRQGAAAPPSPLDVERRYPNRPDDCLDEDCDCCCHHEAQR